MWDGRSRLIEPSSRNLDPAKIRNTFRYHSPTPAKIAKIRKYERIRAAITDVALLVGSLTPDSMQRSMSLTLLLQAQMMANASIAIHEPDDDAPSSGP